MDGLVSFGKPESSIVEEEEALSPGMIQILAKMEQQEKRFVVHDMKYSKTPACRNLHFYTFLQVGLNRFFYTGCSDNHS